MVTIADARIGDIPAIRRVLAATWRDTYRSFLSEDAIEKVTSAWHSPEVLRGEIESSTTYSGVARAAQGEVVGMITALGEGDSIYVSRLYVLPSHQRRGIGRRMLEASYRAFPDATRVQLDVEEENPHGRAFYRKLGFAEVGRKSEEVFGTSVRSIAMERDVARDAAPE